LVFWILCNAWPHAAAQKTEEKAPPSQGQLEVTVLHVDKYGIYVPDIVFYWDPSLSRQKISALTAIAERLRNKRATLTYSSEGSPIRDKRPRVLDIAPCQEPTHTIEAWTDAEESTSSPASREQVAGIASRSEGSGLSEPFPQRDVDTSSSATGEVSGWTQPEKPPGEVSAESLPIQKRDVLMLVEHLLHLTSKKSLDSILYYYADSVSYYARGEVSRDYIRRDLGYYFRNWDRIRCALEGDIQLLDTSRPDIKVVRFLSSYRVENAQRSVSGTADNTWKVQRTRTGLKVIDQKQTVLSSRTVDNP
jgi:hypothetical protein